LGKITQLPSEYIQMEIKKKLGNAKNIFCWDFRFSLEVTET
jgi:hypothetical protein